MTEQQYQYTPAGGPMHHQPGNGMAVTGLVMGLLGLVLFWVPIFGWILALLGVIFGGVGIAKAKRVGGRGHGMAIAGLVLGILGLLAGIIIWAVWFMAVKDARNYGRVGVHEHYERQVEPVAVAYRV